MEFSSELIRFLRNIDKINSVPISITNYKLETLIRQARQANLLSRIATILQERQLLDSIDPRPRQHFLNAITIANANTRSAHWEIRDIYRVLHKAEVPFALLKGCAYIQLNNHASKGRLFSDTDIIVPKIYLKAAERELMHNGWITTTFDRYTQHYYRTWSHELPPMHHLKRHTTLDLHHAIVPPIARIPSDAGKLWEHAVEIADMPGMYVLSPIDRILHSATHLFHEGEFHNGLRDLSDLDLLLRETINEQFSWQHLLNRAIDLHFQRPLYYALRFTKSILHTPVPDWLIRRAGKEAKLLPLQQKWMDLLFMRSLIPSHETAPIRGAEICRWLLFIRSHWLKMPTHLLLPHLSRKSWLRLLGKNSH